MSQTALDISRLIPYHDEVPSLSGTVPGTEVLTEIRAHGSHGHIRQYQEPHLCLNERQELALLFVEDFMRE